MARKGLMLIYSKDRNLLHGRALYAEFKYQIKKKTKYLWDKAWFPRSQWVTDIRFKSNAHSILLYPSALSVRVCARDWYICPSIWTANSGNFLNTYHNIPR